MATNEVAVKEKTGIASYLTSPAIIENITNVLGKDHVDRFIADVVACVQNNETLAQCTNKSIFSAALLTRSINLPLTPQLGYCYLVPYDNKKQINGRTEYVKEAVFQMGWKGYVQLALRSNNYRKLIATDVRKGEVADYNPFEDQYAIHPLSFEKRMEKTENGNFLIPIIGYYAKFELVNGFMKEAFMSHEDMLAHAKTYSKSYRRDLDKHTSYSYWTTKFEDMAKKTMIRQLLSKWGLLTAELEKAYIHDMAIEREDGTLDYIDNKPDDAEPVVNPFTEVVVDAEVIPAEIEQEADEVFK